MKSNGPMLVLLVVIGIAFSTTNAQSCSGESSGGAQDCDESGNKFDYSFDGMPKPHNWRDLPEYGYLLEAEGNIEHGSTSAPPPPSRRSRSESQPEFHEYKEPVEQHQNSESLDDFASWEREMAEANNVREESFLESRFGKFTLASIAGVAFTCALVALRSQASRNVPSTEENSTTTNDKVKEKKKKGEEGKKNKAKASKKAKEKKTESGGGETAKKKKKENDDNKDSEKPMKKEVSDDEEDFVIVKKEEPPAAKKKKKKKKKAPKID